MRRYAELGDLTLVVSVGAIPDVAGLPVAEAEAAITDAGLAVGYADPEFSDDVPVDHVISATPATDPMRPGDTVVLTVSKGPDLVEVPNVITGQTIAQAREQLEALGFTVTSNVPTFLEGAVVASVQSPAAGEQAEARLRGDRQLRLSQPAGRGASVTERPASTQRAASSSATRNASSSDCM